MKKINFLNIFNGFCYGKSIPFVDGLFFNNIEHNNGVQVRIYNNGIAELSLEIDKYVSSRDNIHTEEKILCFGEIIDKLEKFSRCYIHNCKIFSNTK